MTNHSDRRQSYPGFCGLIDGNLADDLSLLDRYELFYNVLPVIESARHPLVFFKDIVCQVRELRCRQRLDLERTNKSRLAEAKAVIKALDRGEPMPRLTDIGFQHMEDLRRRMPGASDRALLTAMQSDLPKIGSRRPPDDALVLGAVALARIFCVHMPSPPTSEKERPFVVLLQAVAKAAGRKRCIALHGVAEEALRIELEAYSPGVTVHSRKERRTLF